MPNQFKFDKVSELQDKMNRAKSVVLTDYRGLSVTQLDELREKVEAAGAEYQITKNTLLSRALSNKETPAEALQGPTATLFAFVDEVAPLKALQDFIKANGLPNVKLGFLGDSTLSSDQISELAKLPGREILLGKLVGSLKSNQYGLVAVLSGTYRKLVYSLDAIAQTKTTHSSNSSAETIIQTESPTTTEESVNESSTNENTESTESNQSSEGGE